MKILKVHVPALVSRVWIRNVSSKKHEIVPRTRFPTVSSVMHVVIRNALDRTCPQINSQQEILSLVSRLPHQLTLNGLLSVWWLNQQLIKFRFTAAVLASFANYPVQ